METQREVNTAIFECVAAIQDAVAANHEAFCVLNEMERVKPMPLKKNRVKSMLRERSMR